MNRRKRASTITTYWPPWDRNINGWMNGSMEVWYFSVKLTQLKYIFSKCMLIQLLFNARKAQNSTTNVKPFAYTRRYRHVVVCTR